MKTKQNKSETELWNVAVDFTVTILGSSKSYHCSTEKHNKVTQNGRENK